MRQMGLTINEDKTVIRNAQKEHFDFLGYTFGAMWFTRDGTQYMGATASRESIKRLKRKVRELLRPQEKGPWPEVCKRLNAVLR